MATPGRSVATTADAEWKQFRGRPPPTRYLQTPHPIGSPHPQCSTSDLSRPAPVHCKQVHSPTVHQGGQRPHTPLHHPLGLAVSVVSKDWRVMSGPRLLSCVGPAGGCARHQTAPAPGPQRGRGSSRAPGSHRAPGALRGGKRSQPALQPGTFWERGPLSTGGARKAGGPCRSPPLSPGPGPAG